MFYGYPMQNSMSGYGNNYGNGYATTQQNTMQQSQQIARLSYVTCIDEAKAAQIPLDGSITVFVNVQNGEIIPSAQATILAVAGNSYHISISTLLRVLKSCPCVIDNTASLQVQVTGTATVNNANIIVIREA